jgi:hypothetical protein
MPPFDFEALKKQLYQKFGAKFISEEDVCSTALYPKVFIKF